MRCARGGSGKRRQRPLRRQRELDELHRRRQHPLQQQGRISTTRKSTCATRTGHQLIKSASKTSMDLRLKYTCACRQTTLNGLGLRVQQDQPTVENTWYTEGPGRDEHLPRALNGKRWLVYRHQLPGRRIALGGRRSSSASGSSQGYYFIDDDEV